MGMIPKIIHYCWFGKGKMSALSEKCIGTWKSLLPDYQIICWNETNVDLEDPYIDACIRKKKWAFLSDRVRFDALYSHGGVYLDVDMEIVKCLDPLLESDFFIGKESDNWISAGIIGSRPQNVHCAKLSKLIDQSVLQEKKFTPVPKIITPYIKEQFKNNSKEIEIYPAPFFYPYNPYDPNQQVKQLMATDITSDCYAIHHWQKQWSNKKSILSRATSRILNYL